MDDNTGDGFVPERIYEQSSGSFASSTTSSNGLLNLGREGTSSDIEIAPSAINGTEVLDPHSIFTTMNSQYNNSNSSNDMIFADDMRIVHGNSTPERPANIHHVDFGVAIVLPPHNSDANDYNHYAINLHLSSDNQTTPFSGLSSNKGEERNWIIVGVLIALIGILWMVLGAMLCLPITRCIRRRMPVSKKRIQRRYETIEGWLITKVG